jgi:nitroimidazol reductase NimA-like FMN-containing flavoprotein (pyridoxamine 5'-phosphate oxidase superfamily)
MRKREREVKDPRTIHSAIAARKIIRIGIWDGERPCVVPMCFGFSANELYLHSAPIGHKVEAIRRFPGVSFEMESFVEIVPAKSACAFGTRYTSIMGHGKATVVEDMEGKIRGLNVIMRHYSDEDRFDYSEEGLGKVCVIKIAIEELTCKSTEAGA